MIDLMNIPIIDFHAHICDPNNISQVVDVLFGRYLRTCLNPDVYKKYTQLMLKVKSACDEKERKIEIVNLSSFSKNLGVDSLRARFEGQLLTIPAFRYFIRYMARSHSCAADIVSIDKAMADELENPREYHSDVLKRENVVRVILDLFGKTTISDNFPAEKASWVYRIDKILQPSWASEKGYSSLNQVIDNVINDLHSVVEKGCVGFKSAMAYSRTVEVSNPTQKQASDALRELLNNPNQDSKELKTYQDFITRQILIETGSLDMPFLYHLGPGGPGPRPNSRNLDPDGLRSILDDPNMRNTRIVILHCGYPHTEKAAIMGYQYSNFYIDLSVPIFFHGYLERSLMTLLQFTPHQKLFYGSDAYHTPETYAFDAYFFKKTLKNVLTQLSARYNISEEESQRLCHRIFFENARDFLKLSI